MRLLPYRLHPLWQRTLVGLFLFTIGLFLALFLARVFLGL